MRGEDCEGGSFGERKVVVEESQSGNEFIGVHEVSDAKG